MRFLPFVVLLLAAPAVFAQEDAPARQVLDDCIESIDYDVLGMEAIEIVCPGLEAALEELGVASLLSEQQRELIGLRGLINLQSIEQRYRETPGTVVVEVDSLQSVLDSLQKPAQPAQAEQPLTWFERFKRWLRRVTGDDESATSDSWLSRWLSERQLPANLGVIVLYGAVLLVVGLAIAVVVNEVRVARKARRKSRRTQSSSELLAADGTVVSSITDIDAAAPAERPSIVLRMLVATLVKTGRLRTERSLTHRELTAAANFDAVEQRECFHRIAELAERVVYGGGDVPADALENVVRAGRALNSQLSGAAT